MVHTKHPVLMLSTTYTACPPFCYTDAATMELYHMVCGLNPRVRLATELVHPNNVAYLAPLVPLQGLGLKQQVMLSPAYMSGQVFTADFVDYLMLQVSKTSQTMVMSLRYLNALQKV